MVESTFHDGVKEDWRQVRTLGSWLGCDIKYALGKSESSLLLSIHLEFCVFSYEIFRYFFLWKSVSKSIDLLKIYFLIGQYFLVLLCLWVSWHFPAKTYLLFDFLVLRMEMLKKTSNCALPLLCGFVLGPNEGSGEVASSLASISLVQGQILALMADAGGLGMERLAVCSPSPSLLLSCSNSFMNLLSPFHH